MAVIARPDPKPERPDVGDSGKAAFRVRFADRERRYVVEGGTSVMEEAIVITAASGVAMD